MKIPGEHEMEFRLGMYPRQKVPAILYPDPIPKVKRQVVVKSSVVLMVGGEWWNPKTKNIPEKL